MRSDVHTAALRAAAKVAFSVTFLGGCAAATTDLAEGDPATGGYGSEPATSEADLSAKGPKKKPGAKADGCRHDKDASVAKPSCEQVVAVAFPTDGNYPGVKQSVSADVQTCCAELLDKSQGALAHHRWDCCANLPADAGQKVSIACTPWGPPVPPSMKRRGKKTEPIPESWLSMQAVA
jgi:hypothetical protein